MLRIWILPRFLKLTFWLNLLTLILKRQWRTVKLQGNPPALKRAFISSKLIFPFFPFLWVIFAFLDPDPWTQLNPDPIRAIRFTTEAPELYSHIVPYSPMLDYTYVTGEEKTAVGSPHWEGGGQAPRLLRGARLRSEKGLVFDSWPGTFCSWNSLLSYSDWGRREGAAPYMHI